MPLRWQLAKICSSLHRKFEVDVLRNVRIRAQEAVSEASESQK